MEKLRHVFIVNPAAGKSSNERKIRKAAEACFSGTGAEYEIILTRAPGHAAEIARKAAEGGEPVRLYSCGGDGTLNEVANGAAGRENAQVACVPVGSGNDYIKVFGAREEFLDLPALIAGTPREVDLIRINGRYAVNLCSMGFDAEVAVNLERFRRLPAVTGRMAYNLSVSYCLLKKMRTPMEISIDGGTPRQGNFLFCVVACGRYYGGSFLAAPPRPAGRRVA